jgi:hypothetical protein
MAKYSSFDPNAEIIGQNVLGFLQCITSDQVLPYLKKHGLEHVEPDQWYPLQKWLDVLSDLSVAAEGGAMQNFVSIGMTIAETAIYPPEYEAMPFEQKLAISNDIYQMQHRNGYVGEQHPELLGPGEIKLSIKSPYPDDLAYGVLWGQARRFLPRGSNFVIEYDDAIRRRDDGGEVTIYHIRWNKN